jgi:hypothetical protein
MSSSGYAELIKIFEEIENEMRAKFERARISIKHSALKGSAFENTLKDFLIAYLPKHLSFSRGMIVDSDGKYSKEIDIIIYDTANTPIFEKSGDIQVIPVECVYGVIEVKAYLDTDELKKIYENLDSVRNFSKKSFFKSGGAVIYVNNVYGKEWDFWPINYFVFAIDSMKLDKIAKYIEERNKNETRELWNQIDTICVLEKGLVYHQKDNIIYPEPEPGTKITVDETNHPLLKYYALLSRLCNQMTMVNKFSFNAYIGELHF